MTGGTLLGGRYRLAEEIGSGGMARVYRATDTVIDRTVAVKLLRDQYADDSSARERFLREARSAGRLQHPHVVPVYDVGEDSGRFYLVMPLVEGRTLREEIDRRGRLPVAEALTITAQVADALAMAHRNGIVHRDVKPGNILLGPAPADHANGRGERWAYLADFGIARAAGEAGLSASNEVFGTAQYLAPERIRGEPATPASDVYGLGIVLYELLTGRTPYQGESAAETALAHVQQPVPSLRDRFPAIPTSVEAIVRRALAKRPAERFATASDLASALRAVLTGSVSPTNTITSVPDHPTLDPRGFPVVEEDRSGFSWRWAVFGFVAALIILAGGITAMVVAGRLNRTAASPSATATVAPSPTARPSPVASPSPTVVASIVVPPLAGVELATARQQLLDAGFEVKEGGSEASSSVPAGRVIRSNPPTGQRLTKGATVELVISRGPENIEVPRVANARIDQARSQIERLGLKVTEVFERSERVAEDFVIAQEPDNGRVQPGSTITLRVSKGRKVQVPEVVGQTENQAKAAIERAGLRNAPYVNQQGRDQVPENVLRNFCVGCVLSVTPGPGQWVDANTEVFLAVRKAE